MEPDFSGYATKNGLKCSDGRTILPGAFKHNAGSRVPLVWQHQHQDSTNVLGHAILEDREDGVYALGYFNETMKGKEAKLMVQHGDITALSIYANNLKQQNYDVVHGNIREVSLVLAGANPGATIDHVNLRHSLSADDDVESEAIIFTGLTLEHAETTGDNVAENTETKQDEKTVKDIYESMTPEQQGVLHYMVGEALAQNEEKNEEKDGEDAEHSELNIDELTGSIAQDIIKHFQEDPTMSRNVFDKNDAPNASQATLSHDQLQTIVKTAEKTGSFKDAFLAHAAEYGFENIDVLFPDAKSVASAPDLIARRMEWVSEVVTGAKHSPFARIKTVAADITADEARARGYVKGNLKKEEIVRLLGRKTLPTTVYKKQKLDRDDIIDITDLDVVAWLKGEMRIMLDEELGRAILLGDGREYGDEDKIDEESIRPIAKDDPMYAHPVTLGAGLSVESTIESLIRARSNYRGTGQPVFFTTLPFLTDMLLHKDKVGRRVYESVDALASALMVRKIVTVEVMEQETEVVGIFVNLSDYTIGADKGGNVSMFDDFDIDYNQYKYLIETRVSGALTKPKSAVVVKKALGTLVTPTSPSFDGETDTITFPTITGVTYTIEGIPVDATETITTTTEVIAVPASGYSFPSGTTTNWTFVPTP